MILRSPKHDGIGRLTMAASAPVRNYASLTDVTEAQGQKSRAAYRSGRSRARPLRRGEAIERHGSPDSLPQGERRGHAKGVCLLGSVSIHAPPAGAWIEMAFRASMSRRGAGQGHLWHSPGEVSKIFHGDDTVTILRGID